jgi:hypothetical protein
VPRNSGPAWLKSRSSLGCPPSTSIRHLNVRVPPIPGPGRNFDSDQGPSPSGRGPRQSHRGPGCFGASPALGDWVGSAASTHPLLNNHQLEARDNKSRTLSRPWGPRPALILVTPCGVSSLLPPKLTLYYRQKTWRERNVEIIHMDPTV